MASPWSYPTNACIAAELMILGHAMTDTNENVRISPDVLLAFVCLPRNQAPGADAMTDLVEIIDALDAKERKPNAIG
jgi:hypothetical protein